MPSTYLLMSCTQPLHMIKIDVNTNKELIALKNAGFKTNLEKKIAYKIYSKKLPDYYERHKEEWGPYTTITDLPCGHCLGCKVKTSKDWAIRCWAEAQESNYTYFITLTYADEYNDNQLHVEHVQTFIKKIRKYYYDKTGITNLRYIICGEYGTTTNRPHYHIILFTPAIIPDLSLVFEYEKDGHIQYVKKSNKQGQPYYYSKLIETTWGKGQCATAKGSMATYAYVARYITKKNNDNQCFILASLKPGIGTNYFIKNYKKILNEGIVINGQHFNYLPRAWEKKLEEIDPEAYFQYQINKTNKKTNYTNGQTSLNEQHETEERKLKKIDEAKKREL